MASKKVKRWFWCRRRRWQTVSLSGLLVTMARRKHLTGTQCFLPFAGFVLCANFLLFCLYCGLNFELADAIACALQIWCGQMHLWPSLMWFTSWNINTPFIVVLNAVVLSDGHLMSVVIEACDIWHQIQCKYWRLTRFLSLSLSPFLSLSLYYLLHRICWKESGQ